MVIMGFSELRCNFVFKTMLFCPRLNRNIHFAVIKKNYNNYIRTFGQCDEVSLLICEGCVYRRKNGWVPFGNNNGNIMNSRRPIWFRRRAGLSSHVF